MTINGGTDVQGPISQGGSGQPSESAVVPIDSDVRPVWETESLPDWVVYWLIPMLSAGQKWPEASESGLSKLAQAYADLAGGATSGTPAAGAATRVVVTGWAAPSTAEFVTRAQTLHGQEGGLAGVSANAHAYAQQSSNFAVETQYSKLSINVAFWVTVVAIGIALLVAFFTAGSTTALVGPYAAAARAAFSRILTRLMIAGARQLTVRRLARVTALSGATGPGLLTRLLGSSLGRELFEEIGEEFFIDAMAQRRQIEMGTRTEWDWQKSQAAIIGAGTGAVLGTRVAGPVSQLTSTVPGFAGRALTTGATNMIASPAGSFMANGLVYDQWQNPFTTDSLTGAFLGGVGRTGTISPFNPDVLSALTDPVSTLASAYDAAARTDAGRAGDPPAPPGSNPPGGGPSQDGGSGPVRTNEPARTGPAPASGGTPRPGSVQTSDSGRTTDTDPPSNRRATTQADRDDQPDPRPEPDTDEDAETTPQTEESGTPEHRGQDTRTTTQPAQDSTDDTRADEEPTQDTTPGDLTTEEPAQDSTPHTRAAEEPAQDTTPGDLTTEEPAQDSTPDTRAAEEPAQDPGRPSPDARTAEQPADDPAGQPVQDSGHTGEQSPAGTPSPGTTTTAQPDGTTTQTGITGATAPSVNGTAPVTVPTAADPDPDLVGAGTYQSKPGTVTSKPVPGTRYVPGGRKGPDLTLDEVLAAAAELLKSYFLDGTVTGITWAEDGQTLAVHTTTNGTQYFRPSVGGLSSDELMGETTFGVDEKRRFGRRRIGSTKGRPHMVRFNPRVENEQLSRVWLHEITDVLQELRSPRRSILPRRRPNESTENRCVPARLNELAMLADKWRQAQTNQEKRLLAVDIDGVLRELSEHGHPTPAPPWAPAQATRQQQARPLPGPQTSADEMQKLITELTSAEQAIQQQIDAKKRTAKEAREERRQTNKEIRQTRKHHDQSRFERVRKLRQERQKARALELRHLRIAAAYQQALSQLTLARQNYQQALSARRFAALPRQAGEVSMVDTARRLATQATWHHRAYLQALANALPQEAALSTAIPTGGLAHLTTLTSTVNELLERHGAQHRFAPDELERALRADFHKVVSPDGVVLRVGRGRTAAEIRIKLTLSDLVELIDPKMKASEMMVGLFYQAARTVSATATSSGGLSGGVSSAALAAALPEGEWPRALVQLLGASVGFSSGRNRSTTGGAGMYAQGGSVADNRNESLLFDAAANWTVEIRTSKGNGWQDTTVVDSGAPGDPAGQRLWISHSYTDQPPGDLVRIPKDQRDPKLGNVVVSHMTGLGDAFDQIAAELGGSYGKVGTVSREQLHAFIADELPHRLRHAVNTGIERVFMKNGEPHARVYAKTEIVLEEAAPLGGPTSAEWEEEVLVDFVAAPGGAETKGSLEGNASLGPKLGALEGVDGPGDYSPGLGPQIKGSRSTSRSYSATANQQAIHPSVHRETSPKQGYRLVLKTTFVVEEFGKKPRELEPVYSDAVVSMRESAAYRYGLPIDSRALRYENGQPLTHPDGRRVLRGEPKPGPPPGFKAELPEFIGEGPGKMRGAGPGLVQDITGLQEFKQDLLKELAEHGLVPKMVNGQREYARNKLARAAQILNLQEVEEQLSEGRIRSGYDPLAQDGISFDLVKLGLNSTAEFYTVDLSLKQIFKAENVEHSTAKTAVALEIGSDTSARAISRSRTYGGTGTFGVGDGPEEGHDGLSHELSTSGGGNRTRTVGSSSGGTVNVVTLQESSGPVAIMTVSHVLNGKIRHREKTIWETSRKGAAKLVFDADLLPPVTPVPPAPLGRVSDRLQSRLKLLHLDVPDSLSAAERVLPEGMRQGSPGYQKLRAMLNVRNLVSHAKLLSQPLVTKLAVRAQGMTSRSSLSVSGSIRDAEVVSVVDQVNGNILFGLASAGVSWGGSSGITTGGSRKLADLDDGGATNDSGTLSGPTRSGGTSDSTSITDIWGTEELTIEFDRQYIVRATLDLTLTGSESKAKLLPGSDPPSGEVRSATAEGTALFSLPEYDALLMYAEGDLDLPGRLVGDAIDRLLNGSLPLDRTLAVPLVQRYVAEVAKAKAAGENVEFAERHTPAALADKLKELSGVSTQAATPAQPDEERLAQTLSEAADLIQQSRDVVLAPSYDLAMSVGAAESLTLTDGEGNPVGVFDAMLDAVRAGAPEALEESPTLLEELAVDFSADSALIHVTDMWSPLGFEKSYHVQAGPDTTQAEEVTVNARLVFANPEDSRRGTLLTRTSQAGVIVQHYRYNDYSHSESYNGSYGISVGQAADEPGYGENLGASTDRGRSYSSSINQQSTRLLRQGRFSGLDRVQQNMTLVIEVTRRPVGTSALLRRPQSAPPVKYDASLVRRIPTGMTRPEAQDPGLPGRTVDPRPAELRPGFFPEALRADPDKPSLFEVATGRLSKMVGAKAVDERRPELLARLRVSAQLTAIERMMSPDGHVERVASLRFKHQGARVTIRARASDLTILAGPFDGEKGQVDRKADAQNVTVSRSRVLPAGVSAGGSESTSGVNAGVRAGEQASESVTDHHGARRERSGFEKGTMYTIRLRVDYDFTFEHVTRLRNQDERAVGDPIHLPSASGGEMDVTLSEEELLELMSRMEAGVRLAPAPEPESRTFLFVPADGRNGLIQSLRDAQVAAREKGRTARVAVWDNDNVLHRYLVDPRGSIRSEKPDGGFAEAFATLPPEVLDAADQADRDLLDVFMNSGVSGTFTAQVKDDLAAHGIVLPDIPTAFWVPVAHASNAPAGGTTAQGFSGGSPSPALPGTIFDRMARPDGTPDLTPEEVRGQDLSALDLGGAAAHLSWTSGDRLTVQFPGAPDQHVRVLVEDPGEGLNGFTEPHAGTREDPHVVRLWQRVHPDLVSSILVHELSHVAQAATAAAAGAPQGVIRPSLSEHQHEGDDLCLTPRMDEYAHLARKWRAATDPGVRGNLADAIDAIAADLESRGHTPPPPPWGTGPRDAAPEPQSRIARLLNGGPAAFSPADRAPLTLPEAAATAAVERAAAHLGARTHIREPGRLDIYLPGHAPIPVDIHPPAPAGAGQSGRPEAGGVAFQVDHRLTIGATERAAAATVAEAIARARGQAAADHAALAQLNEAVRQVRAATVQQRPGRLGVLFDLLSTTSPDVVRLLPEPVAAELATLANGTRPRDLPAHLQRLRTLANGTGWLPPTEACHCPASGPCTCGAETPSDTTGPAPLVHTSPETSGTVPRQAPGTSDAGRATTAEPVRV